MSGQIQQLENRVSRYRAFRQQLSDPAVAERIANLMRRQSSNPTPSSLSSNQGQLIQTISTESHGLPPTYSTTPTPVQSVDIKEGKLFEWFIFILFSKLTIVRSDATYGGF